MKETNHVTFTTIITPNDFYLGIKLIFNIQSEIDDVISCFCFIFQKVYPHVSFIIISNNQEVFIRSNILSA